MYDVHLGFIGKSVRKTSGDNDGDFGGDDEPVRER